MATPLPEKVSFSLSETRMLMLGAEMGLGFQFHIPFDEQFPDMPPDWQWVHAAALSLMLLTVVVIIAPMMVNSIVFGGHASSSTQELANVAVEFGLATFALSLGLSLAGCVYTCGGPPAAWACAAAFLIAGGVLWYGHPLRSRRRAGKASRSERSLFPMKPAFSTPLSNRIRDVLTEARIILPGAQAMLGFQMVAFFTKAYTRLPPLSRWLHVAAVAFLLGAIILLMAPPAFHRLVEEGEETERMHRYSQRVVVLAAIPFGCSLACDFYVTLRMVAHHDAAAAIGAAILLIACAAVWFGYPAAARKRQGQPAR